VNNGMAALHIRTMTADDLDFAAQCAIDVGWQTTFRQDFEKKLAYDPNGCFVAEEDGERVGVCIGTSYGASGFIGDLIVVQAARQRGVGGRLLAHTIAYLESAGATSVFLDANLAAVPLYERTGFRKVCRSFRFNGIPNGSPDTRTRRMQAEDLESVLALDREAFGADRSFFLRRFWEGSPELGWVHETVEGITAFLLGKRTSERVWIGPWVVTDGDEGAASLLVMAGEAAGGLPVHLGVLESHLQALEIVRSLGITGQSAWLWRMVYGDLQELGLSRRCFGICSSALG
jgi:ribosomal protein S18 acetylase RimI-like enzyme